MLVFQVVDKGTVGNKDTVSGAGFYQSLHKGNAAISVLISQLLWFKKK